MVDSTLTVEHMEMGDFEEKGLCLLKKVERGKEIMKCESGPVI